MPYFVLIERQHPVKWRLCLFEPKFSGKKIVKDFSPTIHRKWLEI